MNDTEILAGSDNVFADIGFPDAVEKQTKTRLALAINEIMRARKLRQVEAARILGIPQPKVSALANYRVDGFSVEKLMQFLTSLDQDVEIMIRPRKQSEGSISVVSVR